MKTVGWYWLGAFLAALVIFNGFYFLSDPEIPWWIQLTNFLIAGQILIYIGIDAYPKLRADYLRWRAMKKEIAEMTQPVEYKEREF
jgi:hypothetical protein